MTRRLLTVIGMALLAVQVSAQEPRIPEHATARLGYAPGVNNWNKLREQTGAAFLAENQSREGYGATASGLQYKVPGAGDGDMPDATELNDIRMSFKLDSHLTQSLYMGERWVSPPTYKGTAWETDTYTVEARSYGVDAQGRNIRINPEWIASNREMVAVSPARGNAVSIVVRQAGESRLKVVAAGFTKELLINATRDDKLMQVEISQ